MGCPSSLGNFLKFTPVLPYLFTIGNQSRILRGPSRGSRTVPNSVNQQYYWTTPVTLLIGVKDDFYNSGFVFKGFQSEKQTSVYPGPKDRDPVALLTYVLLTYLLRVPNVCVPSCLDPGLLPTGIGFRMCKLVIVAKM